MSRASLRRFNLLSAALLLFGCVMEMAQAQSWPRDRRKRQEQQEQIEEFRNRGRGGRNLGGGLNRDENPNRPTVSLKVTPTEVYPGDTLRIEWSVTSADVATPWSDPVRISCSFTTLPRRVREDAGASGSVEVRVPADIGNGNVTLNTGQALYAASKSVTVKLVPTPVLQHVLVQSGGQGRFQASAHALAGDRIRLQGSHFGTRQGQGRACLVLPGQTVELPVVSWSDERAVVSVPNDTPVNAGHIVIAKGEAPRDDRDRVNNRFGGKGGDDNRQLVGPPGRLVSNEVAFSIWGREVVTSDQLRDFANNALGIGGTRIMLDRGENASSVDFNFILNGLGIDDEEFTLPSRRLASRGFAARFYVNDIESINDDIDRDPEIAINGGQVVLGALFESDGDEIIAEGVGALPDDFVPNVQMDDIRVNVRLTPTVDDGRLAFNAVAVRFDADVQVGADWLNDVIDLSDFEEMVSDMIKDELLERLNTAQVRNGLANALMDYFSTGRELGPIRIRALSADGDRLTFLYDKDPDGE